MDYNKAALELHSKFPGKIAVQSLCECKDRDALSTAYTPGVAEPCRKIKANPDDVYTYDEGPHRCGRHQRYGSAGPGQHRPLRPACPSWRENASSSRSSAASMHSPICLNAKTKRKLSLPSRQSPRRSGGINLEDIRSPECFEIEAELERELDIPCSTTTSTARPSSCWRAC